MGITLCKEFFLDPIDAHEIVNMVPNLGLSMNPGYFLRSFCWKIVFVMAIVKSDLNTSRLLLFTLGLQQQFIPCTTSKATKSNTNMALNSPSIRTMSFA